MVEVRGRGRERAQPVGGRRGDSSGWGWGRSVGRAGGTGSVVSPASAAWLIGGLKWRSCEPYARGPHCTPTPTQAPILRGDRPATGLTFHVEHRIARAAAKSLAAQHMLPARRVGASGWRLRLADRAGRSGWRIGLADRAGGIVDGLFAAHVFDEYVGDAIVGGRGAIRIPAPFAVYPRRLGRGAVLANGRRSPPRRFPRLGTRGGCGSICACRVRRHSAQRCSRTRAFA